MWTEYTHVEGPLAPGIHLVDREESFVEPEGYCCWCRNRDLFVFLRTSGVSETPH